MGKFLETKYSSLQNRVIKKPGKSIQRNATDHDEYKHTKIKRKICNLKSQEPPLKKLKTAETLNESKEENTTEVQNQIALEFQELEIELKTNESTGHKYLKLVKHDEDLFADDDLKARYDQFTNFNMIFVIFDQIALEGLDGITIEAFWKRLSNALKYPTCMDNFKDCIWHIICSNEQIVFYELPEPRQDLFILSRDAYVNKETNEFMEVYQTGPDIYKVDYAPKGNMWGSCATFSTRVDISKQVRNMTLEEAYSTYKNKLAMVADQTMRLNALVDDLTDPNYEFTQTEYCLLERIGRSRELGEITQGPAALSNYFGMDSKSLFHYCQKFKQANLVTKQFFCLRSTINQNKIGRLLQLRRFYSKKKSKYMILAESIVNYLKKCPDYKAPFTAIGSIFGGTINPKFFKNQEFQRYVDTHVYLPYKELYPDAKIKEYMTKSLAKEKIIHVMQLKDPYINIAACWSDTPHLTDSSDDEDENEDDIKNTGKSRILNMEFVREVYLAVYAKGTDGCMTQEINRRYDVDYSTLRSVLKKLVSRNLITSKKCDMGRQKTNLYMATCFTNDPNPKVALSTPPETAAAPSSVIERLKARQKKKFDSLPKERVYTRQEFEADQQLNELVSEKPSDLPVSFAIPQVTCEYLISNLTESKIQETILFAEFKGMLIPFKINLRFPKLDSNTTFKLRQILPSTEAENQEILKWHFKDFCIDNFKPDYLTKAILLQALFGEKINKKEILELLDPNIKKLTQGIKRERPEQSTVEQPQPSTSRGDGHTSTRKVDLANYMGPHPVTILTENDEAGEVLTELYMSTPPKVYKTGDISKYVCPPDISTTERIISRIKIILDTINSQKVFEEVNKFLKLISNKESEEGYDKKIDRKSLHRIIGRLVNEGYIKLYQFIVSNKTVKKTLSYICHPEVDHTHEVIWNGIDQIKFRFFCGNTKDVEVVEPVIKKPKPVESSPFGEDDVLQSIQEINELHPPRHITLKAISSKKAGKLYGFRPKFARMSLLHEVLFYLIYVLDKDTKPLPKNEVSMLFRKYKINLTEEDFKKLPPVYCKEISWKMFIPPLPRHEGWSDGWVLICDVILRIPLSLIVRLYCINFISTELQEILQHPIKRFYLIKNFTPQIQYLVMYRRKCIHDIHFILVRLAYCGLLQFGPSRYKEKDQGFIYFNRKASLLETMTSDPGYHKITNKKYNKVPFYFDSLETVTNYWFTMHNICMNTLLNARHVVEGKTITLVDVSAKPSLNKVLAVKTNDEAKKYDTGEIPGDQRGAAGLDSALWSHIQKNWYYFAPKSQQSFMDELASLKLNQVMPYQVSFDHLKLPPMASKFYISKVVRREVRPTPICKVKTKTSKKLPVVKKLMPMRRKRPNKIREYYDNVDRAILRKHSGIRFRPNWSEEEDKVLILLKIAATFVTPGTNKQVINYTAMRDVMHRWMPESRLKTSQALPRRLKILFRDVPFLANLNTFILNLYKLPIVAQYFVPLRKYILDEKDNSGRKYKLSEPEIHNAFIFMAYYMLTHRNEVETTLHGNLTTMDYFNNDNLEYTVKNLLPLEPETKHYTDPKSVEDIRKYVLKNIFHSALGHKKDHPAWSYQMYKIYQKFNQDILKKTIEELREQHMIQSKKEPLRKFFNPYKFSLSYVFTQTTMFTYHTMEEAYMTFLDVKNTPQKFQFNSDIVEAKKYGQLFGLNEILTFTMSQVNLKFWLPERHFILNPAMEDHSQVIAEIAKRYQAKLRNDQKDAEFQTSAQVENAFPEISEPEPGPSTSIPSEEIEILQFDEDEPLDLTITSTNSTTITNLKHWISDCIDAERVRSPSPELLNLDVSHEQLLDKKNEAKKKLNEIAELKEKDVRILSLEEIKEEMLKITPANEKRQVPYITDLIKLLSENFEEMTGDQAIDEMKKHFVQQYPCLEELNIEDFNNHFLVEYLEKRPVIKDLWKRVEEEAYIVEPSSNSEAFDEILEKGGTIEDISLASELINFIYNKGVFGATGSELKDNFYCSEGNCTLEFILKILTNHNILLRTGVCTIIFVHHTYQSPWLTDTFVLTDEHIKVLKKEDSQDQLVKMEEDIDARIQSAQWLKIKSFPWSKVDGTLDKDLFKVWLSSIFSYCVENPKTLLTSVCDKFCFLKPLDLFYLVEILQELGCLEMRCFQQQEFDLFSECELVNDREATILDNFDEIYIDANQISFISLGSFFRNT